jgi:thiamine biosynthesis lipoprotein
MPGKNVAVVARQRLCNGVILPPALILNRQGRENYANSLKLVNTEFVPRPRWRPTGCCAASRTAAVNCGGDGFHELMSSELPDDAGSSRRDFLTGRAALRGLQQAGDAFADSLTVGRPFQTGHTVRLETKAMACPWNVVINPGPPEQVMAASHAFDVVHRVEHLLTVYRDDSDIAKINAHAAETPQQVEESLYSFLTWCRDCSTGTSGAFDPASRPLIQLWRDCRLANRIPSEEEIQQGLAVCGISRIEFDDARRTVRFPKPGFAFDFGAAGKGWAVDRAAQDLRSRGVTDFLIHGGHSSVFASGDHVGQGGWPVGLRNPLFLDEPYATVLLSDEALGTSGSNVQYFRYEGRRYGHILDPRTGWPAEGLLSVTVIAPTALEADAISTALYVMGLEKAVEWCQDHPRIGAILVPPADAAGRLAPVLVNLAEERLLFLPAD